MIFKSEPETKDPVVFHVSWFHFSSENGHIQNSSLDEVVTSFQKEK